MKKLALSFIFIIMVVYLFSTCASVNTQGANYFIKKSEKDLINHFGYNGTIQEFTGNNEYEKVVFFTNKIIKYQVSKINTARYKDSRQTEIMVLSFNEFSDGCLVDDLSRVNYGMHIYDSAGTVMHVNNNSEFRPLVNNFNNIINRSNAYPTSQRNIVFNNSNIGDTYYLYESKSESRYRSGVTGKWQSETYNNRLYGLWQINVVADDRSETEAYIIGQYYERQNQYYSGNGNSIITVPQINNLIEEYRSKGFTYTTKTEGLSLFAYIKNGKVVKVEEKK